MRAGGRRYTPFPDPLLRMDRREPEKPDASVTRFQARARKRRGGHAPHSAISSNTLQTTDAESRRSVRRPLYACPDPVVIADRSEINTDVPASHYTDSFREHPLSY